RRNPRIVDESGRLMACPGRTSHRRAIAADARYSGPKRACPASGGQIWTRLYARRKSFPQVIHSSKRFAGPTGLEECVGRGVGMSLRVYAREGALVFRSENYFVAAGARRFFLPRWLCPGTLYVTHAEVADGKFSFTLQIFH